MPGGARTRLPLVRAKHGGGEILTAAEEVHPGQGQIEPRPGIVIIVEGALDLEATIERIVVGGTDAQVHGVARGGGVGGRVLHIHKAEGAQFVHRRQRLLLGGEAIAVATLIAQGVEEDVGAEAQPALVMNGDGAVGEAIRWLLAVVTDQADGCASQEPRLTDEVAGNVAPDTYA